MPQVEITASDGRKQTVEFDHPPSPADVDHAASVVFGVGKPLPVLPLSVTQAPRPPALVNSTANLLGGSTSAIARPDAPDWLQTIEGLAAPTAGVAAAGAAAPLAGLAGILTGGGPMVAGPIEAGAFTAATMAAERAMQAGNRLLGYRTPRKQTIGETAVEAGTTALSYPLGNAIPSLLAKGAGRVTGVTARRAERAAVASDTEKQLQDTLWTLHGQVEDVAQNVEGRLGKAESRLETRARNAASRASARAVPRMIQGQAGLSDAGQTAVSRDLGSAALEREQTLGALERLYTRTQGALGAEYDELVKPFLKEAVPPEVVANVAQRILALQAEQQAYQTPPGSLNKILTRMSGWAGEAEMERAPIAPAGTSASPAEVARLRQLLERGGAAPEPVTFGDLQAIRGDLRTFYGSDNAPARYASRAADRAILDAYDTAGLPRNPDLDRRYRIWRQRWDTGALRTLYRSEKPEDVSRLVTGDMVEPLMGQAESSDRASVKRLMARVIRDENPTPGDLTKRFSPTILRDYFGRGADDVAKWAHVDARAAEIPQILHASPEINKRFLAEADRSFDAAMDKGAKRIRSHAVQALKALGAPALKTLRDVRAMSPQQATRFYLDVMRGPEFGEALVTSAREGVPLPPIWRLRHGIGFGIGLAGYELAERSHITSPWATFSVMVGGGVLASGLLRRGVIQLLERKGFEAGRRVLDGAVRETTRSAGMKDLARQLGQITAADAMRGLTTPSD